MAKRRKKTFRPRIWRAVFIALLALVLFGTIAATSLVVVAVRTMPALSSLEPQPSLTSMVFDAEGNLIAELHGVEHRVPIKLASLPGHVPQAFLAIEDHTFYQHHGFRIEKILYAFYKNVITSSTQGGSTITQQTAKNAFTGAEREGIRGYLRKIQELILAILLERHYTKDEILEMYLNQIHFGHGTNGIEAASRYYFGKSAADLSVAEAATLAGLVQLPHVYSPVINPTASRNRRAVVLQRMVECGYITAAEAQQYSAEELTVIGKSTAQYPAPYFVDYVLAQLLEKLEKDPRYASLGGRRAIYEGGLKIYTTVDPVMQQAAETAIAAHLDPVFPLGDTPQPEMAAVFIDPRTGQIKAMVGGRKHDRRLGLNRAWQSVRQPGSAMKPISVYAPALELGLITPATVIDDAPIGYPQLDGSVWYPKNYDLSFKGLTTIRDAVRRSVNVVAVKLIEQIGPRVGLEYAKKSGITTLVSSGVQNDVTLSLALGGLTKGVSPLELAAAYGPFVNRGIYVQPNAILRVEDRFGNVIEEPPPNQQVVYSERTAFLMTSLLRSVVETGTGWRAQALGRPAGGKTGTTTDNFDAWWVGVTPEYVGAVWMGYDQPKNMGGFYGGNFPARVWTDVMKAALANQPVRDFAVPRGIIQRDICVKSGLLFDPNECGPADRFTEYFSEDNAPTQLCNAHVYVRVCADHPGYLASEACPNPVLRRFLNRPYVEPHREVDEETGEERVFFPADAHLGPPREVCPFHGPEPPGDEGGTGGGG